MKKNALRILALILVVTAAALALTGCFGMMGEMPKVTNEEAKSETPYEQRKLGFVQNAAAAQVNVDTPLGFFCYEDNKLRILTENSKTEEHDDSVSYTVTVYDGRKAEGAQPAVGSLSEDRSNKLAEGMDYAYCIKENGYLYLNSRVLGDVEITASCANGSAFGQNEPLKLEVAPHTIKLFDIIIGGIGLYLIFSAIVGKGKLFQNDFIKEGKEEEHKKIVRITSLVIGVLMLATVAIALFDKYGEYRLVSVGIFGVVLVAFIISTILLRRCTDLEAKRKAMNDRYAPAGGKTPASAFIFDENEPTVDDVQQ